jgi:hypothetical protein
MASLFSLPAELKLSIIEHFESSSTSNTPIPSQELLSLSRVCRTFRTLTMPLVVKTITLLNEKKNGSSVLTLLDGTYAEHVRDVHYIGISAVPEWLDLHGDQSAPVVPDPSSNDLPESVEHVLSNLDKLPNLERAVVEFRSAKGAVEREVMHSPACGIFPELETDDEVLESERTVAYRSLMERSYRALARNSPCTIKHLELKNIVFEKCSAWKLPDFRAILGGLTSFTISLRGGDKGLDWRINKVDAYLDFVSELDQYFFQHLSNTKHLSFAATEGGPPGIAGGVSNTSLPLLGQHMPQLQTLSLEYVFISGDLVNFITAHGDTLEMVHLTHCFSGINTYRMETNAMSWADFFNGIASQGMKSLRVFDIATTDLERLHPRLKIRPEEYDHRNAVYALQLRKRYPDRRQLDYKSLDEKWGKLHALDEYALFWYQNGHDHEGLERLRDIIKKNARDNN